jgi:hypothetical protein
MAISGVAGLNLKSGGDITETAANIHLNGPDARDASAASCPDLATAPPIIPTYEPWTRPAIAKNYTRKNAATWKP